MAPPVGRRSGLVPAVMTVDQFRAESLAALGLDREHFSRAATRLVEALDAELPDGSADHVQRRLAARELLELRGAYPSRSAQADGAPSVAPVINLAVFAQPAQHPPSTQARVVDVEVGVKSAISGADAQ